MTIFDAPLPKAKLRTCGLCDLTAGEPIVMPGTKRGVALDRCTNPHACSRRRKNARNTRRRARVDAKRKQLEEANASQ